jgi:hypothetical protein
MNTALNLHPKVAAPLLAGSVTELVLYSLGQWAHVNPPTVVGAALTVIIGFVAGWLAPSQVAPAAA